MTSDLEKIRQSFLDSLKSAKDTADLEKIRIHFLGKKSEIAQKLSSLAQLTLEEKKTIGGVLHRVRTEIETHLKERFENFKILLENNVLSSQKIDVTLSSPKSFPSGLHPISKTVKRMHEIFQSMGFHTVFGPEIETEYYNFDALNIPQNHPARDMADTFFLKEDQILRTQTSGVQIREMQNTTPPLAIISPGRCFRKDEIDATHLPLFHQIEGLVVDKNISFADLKGTLSIFAKEFFGSSTDIRFRPDFFPFVEPGAEVAFSCPVCNKKNIHCSTCKGSGYIEVAGCGLVHPKVLENGGIDPNEYSGYAFGFGVERLAMIYYGIQDIRLLYENHPDFLAQFQSPIF